MADRLNSIFKDNRKEYEEKWNDLKLFVNYGMLSESDFYDRAKDFSLITDVDGKSFTFDEYKTLIKDNQTDKDGNLIYLYATDKEEQFTYINDAKKKGYSVMIADGQLDVPTISMLEQKFEKSRFVRVDSNIIDRLIAKGDAPKQTLNDIQRDILSEAFHSQVPKIEKAEFNIEVESLGAENQPVVVTQNEYMRRMKEMSRFQQGMGFYGQMPDTYTLVVNSEHPIVEEILNNGESETSTKLKPILSEIKGLEARLAVLRQEQSKKKAEEVSQEEKDDISKTEKDIEAQKDQKKQVIAGYAKGNDKIQQLIDLALLQNGMLKGADLAQFIKRSISLIK